jgi:hypothetical protein
MSAQLDSNMPVTPGGVLYGGRCFEHIFSGLSMLELWRFNALHSGFLLDFP